jgi:hypothetical protein
MSNPALENGHLVADLPAGSAEHARRERVARDLAWPWVTDESVCDGSQFAPVPGAR